MNNMINNGIVINGGQVNAHNISNSITYHKDANTREDENYIFDIGFSFANEERTLVKELIEDLKKDYTIFYDFNYSTDIWEENLEQYLTKTYFNKCRYCVVIFSEAYLIKKWTQIEWQSMKVRSKLSGKDNFILYVLMDEKLKSNLPEHTAYIDATQLNYDFLSKTIKSRISSI